MKIKFLPQDVEFEVKPGESVLHVAQDHNVHIKSVCRGLPSCAECRVRVVDGEHNVLPPSAAELSLIGSAWFVDRRRLSCQLRCFGDVTIDMTEQIEKAESSTKKPRGRYNKDELQESRAVLGSLVMSDDEPESAEVVTEPVKSLRPRPSGRSGATESAPVNDAGDDGDFDDEEFDGDDGLDNETENLRAQERDGRPQGPRPQQNRGPSRGGGGAQGGQRQGQSQGQQNAGPGGSGEGGQKRRRRNRRGKRRGSGGQGGGSPSGGGNGPQGGGGSRGGGGRPGGN